MPRATWKGFLTFGLVSIPVLLYSGEKRADLQFDLLDSRDQSRIRYKRVNEESGEEVPWDQIVRAYEYSDGNYVMVNEEDFERASIEATKSVAVEGFIRVGEINPLFFEKPYIVVPEKGAEKSYVLLRETMASLERVGIARVVIRGRQYLLALMAQGQAIIAERLRFAQELTDPAQFNLPGGTLREYGISAEELDMAEQLVRVYSTDWQPGRYHDEYRDALMDWIDKKVRTGEDLTEPVEPPQFTENIAAASLTELLRRSLQERAGGTQED